MIRIDLENAPDGTIGTADKYQLLFGVNYPGTVAPTSGPKTIHVRYVFNPFINNLDMIDDSTNKLEEYNSDPTSITGEAWVLTSGSLSFKTISGDIKRVSLS